MKKAFIYINKTFVTRKQLYSININKSIVIREWEHINERKSVKIFRGTYV